MGRIKTAAVKRVTFELVKAHRAEFKKTFGENKLVLGQIAEIPSKKLRNVIAGYVTRLMNREEEA